MIPPHEQIAELYQRCFTEPPWSESAREIAAFAAALPATLARPGLWGLVASDAATVVGVVYGWLAPPLLPADDVHRAIARQVRARLCAELTAPALRVVELMVHPDHRGRGTGRTLLDRYPAGHPSVWLCTHPEAPACRLYESSGWWPGPPSPPGSARTGRSTPGPVRVLGPAPSTT